MKAKKHPHEEILEKVFEEFKHVFHSSKQGIYVYMDDEHKICNEKFATMLGYKSAKEWQKMPTVLDDVATDDQNSVIDAYQNTVKNFEGASLDVSFETRKNIKFRANVIFVPISFDGEIITIHFVRKI